MAKIFEFPKKRNIFHDFKDRFPTETFEPLSIAYIKTKEMSEKFPATIEKLPPSAKEEVGILIREYEELTLILLRRIMGLEKALSIEIERG